MFAEDLTPFFAVRDFGISVVVSRASVVLRTVNALLDSPAQEIAIYDRSFYDEKFYSGKVALNKPSLMMRTVDALGFTVNDTCVVEGATYYIGFLEADGTGLTSVYLSLDQI